MINHTMRTTLILSDQIMAEIKALAAKKRQTLSQTLESLLRLALRGQRTKGKALRPLPSYDMGRCLVNISDRAALQDAMEETK